jgi:hypothetical protein
MRSSQPLIRSSSQFAVLVNLQGVASVFGELPPLAANLKFGGVGSIVEGLHQGELELGGFVPGLAVAALVEEVGIGQVAPVRTLCPLPVEHQPHGIHEGSFAATVEPTNEDDGLVGFGLRAGPQVEPMPPMVGAKVLQDEGLENHVFKTGLHAQVFLLRALPLE